MTFEEELEAGVFVDCICMFCGTHLPAVAASLTAECCEESRAWFAQQKLMLAKEVH